MISSAHPAHYDNATKTKNNLVKVNYYIFESENKQISKNKSSLVSSLSLSIPSICQSLLGKNFIVNDQHETNPHSNKFI